MATGAGRGVKGWPRAQDEQKKRARFVYCVAGSVLLKHHSWTFWLVKLPPSPSSVAMQAFAAWVYAAHTPLPALVVHAMYAARCASSVTGQLVLQA